jgi:uncharacterized membrane protein
LKKKYGLNFFLSTVLGGVFFLVPLVVLLVVLAKVLGIMMTVAEPMADLMPVDTIGGIALANVIAALAVIALCFLAGLLAKHALAGAFVNTIESRILAKLPGYAMIKSLVGGFDKGQTEKLKPVSITIGTAERIGFEIQKLPDGRSVIFLPSTPSPFSGITQVFPPDQVTYLNVPATQIIEVTENFGHGIDKLLDPENIEK